MRKTITPAEMKRVETRAMAETELTGDTLMQAAARHVAETVKRIVPDGRVICYCGCGNNGGDGLAAMRFLATDDAARSFQGECRMLPGELTPDARRELERLRVYAPQVRVVAVAEAEGTEAPDCVIDAMFGTGLSRPLAGEALEACRQINRWHEMGTRVVAVDIPSGLNGATGDAMGEAVRADCTATFHRPKPGLYLQAGPEYAGRLEVAPIGLPDALDDAEGMAVLERTDLRRLLPPRRRNTHKGSYGRVLLFAGSLGMAGAAAISALAALRTGAGLVTVACPERIVDTVQALCPCATCLPLPQEEADAWAILEAKLDGADALGAGCGLGTGAWARALMGRLCEWLKTHELPTVLDADALNLLSQTGTNPGRVFVTPHPAEAARLLNAAVPEVTSDPVEAARRLAQAYGCAVLKGACSVMCDGEALAINPYGCAGMAKGGSGDALTGILAALLAGRAAGAYGMSDMETMQAACALHGLAGERAQALYGERGMLATDLCGQIGLVTEEDATDTVLPAGECEKKPACGQEERTPVLGRRVTITVEHPLRSVEEGPQRRRYPINCGYVQEVLAEQNEWQDAWIVGVGLPLEWFEGVVRARVRLADGREVWVAASPEASLSWENLSELKGFFGDFERIEP